ncbi:hypothetical protein WMY93_024847 [Mugilogobius chulae]|uniref:Anosmin-1 n=1 Tax=Mugilogobius chulae TaxID=88201 RepID=A0AAW0NBT9_9GOBI
MTVMLTGSAACDCISQRTQSTEAQSEMWLQGLQPATAYVLSVQTVAYWGQKRLKSPKLMLCSPLSLTQTMEVQRQRTANQRILRCQHKLRPLPNHDLGYTEYRRHIITGGRHKHLNPLGYSEEGVVRRPPKQVNVQFCSEGIEIRRNKADIGNHSEDVITTSAPVTDLKERWPELFSEAQRRTCIPEGLYPLSGLVIHLKEDSSTDDFSNELPFSSSSSSSLSPGSSGLVPHADSSFNPSPAGALRLEVASPHYHDDQLQVKVFWKWPYHSKQRHPGPYILRWLPHTCAHNATSEERTTFVKGTHHTITGLLFACKYQVVVAMQSDPASEAVAWVTTPSCSSIRLRGGKSLSCNTEEHHLAGRKVVLRPERLTADFQQVNGSLLTTFRWRMSQHGLEQSAVEGFQFTWTLLSQVTATSREDTLISQTQTIAPFQRSVMVSRLQPDSDYQLQLQVLTAGGSTGAAVSKTIHTPVIQASL